MAMLIEPLEERRLLSTVAINTNTQYQTITALGAALSPDGMMNDYTTANFYNEVVNDLGASGVRFAIIPSFEKANDNSDPNTFDWSRFDPNSLAPMMTVLQAMKARGVNTFLGTVWSPPWWMKTNFSQTMGGMVRPDMYSEFAEYLAAAVIVAKSNFGIDISAISPQNEPYFNEPYNSAVYTPDQLREVIRAIGTKFTAENLSTKIVGVDDLNFGNSRVNWTYDSILSDPTVNNDLYAITGHTYGADWGSFGQRIALYNKPFWQTETSGESNNFAGAMAAADNLYYGLTLANASAYFYWQFSSSDPSQGLMTNGVPNQKFYTLKQFYRFIRPGMQRVDVQSPDPLLKVTSFRDPTTGVLTIVAMNENTTDQNVSFSLSGSNLPTLFKQYRTSATENAVQLGNLTSSGGMLSLSIPAQSIVTLYSGPDFTAATGSVPSYVPTPPQWDPKTGRSLATAALNGDVTTVESLIASGADVNDPGVVGWTPLDYAAASPTQGAVQIMQDLINAGANVNARTSNGLTALQIAAMNSGFEKYHVSYYAPTAKFNVLIKAGADVNATDNFGRTALHFAAMDGRVLDIGLSQDPSEVNALLLDGANPSLKDAYGKTPLDYAVAAGYLPQAAAFRAAMGDTTEQPFRGTPIPVQTGKLTFEAEDFDFGGANVAYLDTDPANTGGQYRPGSVDIGVATDTYESYDVTSTQPGEWLKYTASFTNPGRYDLSFRVASATGGGTFHLEVDGVNVTGSLTVPNTGGDQVWADVPVTGITLTAGTHVLKLVFDTAPAGQSIGNFNSITIIPRNLGPAPGVQTPYNGAPLRPVADRRRQHRSRAIRQRRRRLRLS